MARRCAASPIERLVRLLAQTALVHQSFFPALHLATAWEYAIPVCHQMIQTKKAHHHKVETSSPRTTTPLLQGEGGDHNLRTLL